MSPKDTSRRQASRILWSLLVTLGWLLPGRMSLATASAEAQAAKEKEFLAGPDVVTCTLATTAISDLKFPNNRLPSFVRRLQRQDKKEVKQGLLTLAGRPFKVLLGEKPEREFYLFDVEKRFGPYWWGSWSLHSYHKIDGRFYEFVLLENGAEIAARPYKGPLGTIKIGKGGRELAKIEFNGSVHAEGHVAAPIGTIEEYWTGTVPGCKIPVGDYTPYIMRVTYDNLAISISNNYHTNAQGQSRDRETVYGMQVREDKPYVLDFSNDPVVVFDRPPKSETVFSRGDEIKFAAVLVDPKLDVMIRGLDDTSVKVEHESSSGHKYTRSKSLDPAVVITRAGGEIVARGGHALRLSRHLRVHVACTERSRTGRRRRRVDRDGDVRYAEALRPGDGRTQDQDS